MINPCIENLFKSKLPQFYNDLQAAEENGQLDLTKYGYPFIPWCGRNYHDAEKKILYVGRAPYGWDDDSIRTQPNMLLKAAVANKEDFSLLNRITEDYVENYLIPDYGGYGVVREPKETRRKLWQMIYRLTPSILDKNNYTRLGERPKFNKKIQKGASIRLPGQTS